MSINFNANSLQRRRISAGSRPAVSFTTLNSIGKPWQSQPGTNGAANPAMVFDFTTRSLSSLLSAVPMWTSPLAKGGPRGFSCPYGWESACCCQMIGCLPWVMDAFSSIFTARRVPRPGPLCCDYDWTRRGGFFIRRFVREGSRNGSSSLRPSKK